MNDPVDQMLSTRFEHQKDALPAPDFSDVRKRSRRVEVRQARLLTKPRGQRLASIFALLFVAALSGTALAVRFLGPTPALTAGVSALDKLPAVESVPRSVLRQLDRLTLDASISVAEAERQMRLLRTDTTHGDLYAFKATSGTVCVILEDRLATCISDTTMGEPGVLWAVSGGTRTETPALVGIVADNIAGVTLVTNGTDQPLTIKNASFYVVLKDFEAAGDVSLEVEYQDKSTRTIGISG